MRFFYDRFFRGDFFYDGFFRGAFFYDRFFRGDFLYDRRARGVIGVTSKGVSCSFGNMENWSPAPSCADSGASGG